MKVVHLNTGIDESSAPYKLHLALLQSGIDSTILTLNDSDLPNVVTVKKTIGYRIVRKIYSFRRKHIFNKYTPQEYMPISVLPVGIDISKHPLIRDAEVIMLHWVCGDFMSPKTIEKLLKLGKPVYWTCHDNYPFTGGCHVRLGCEGYQTGCGNCPQLGSNKVNDPTRRLLMEKKNRLLKYDNLFILSPSTWMNGNVSKSIFNDKKHFVFPNVINTEIFKPYDKNECREKWDLINDAFVLLIGLKKNEKIPYNGTEYMWKILDLLDRKYPDHCLNNKPIQIVSFGVQELVNKSKFDIKNVGFINGQVELAKLYSAADIYLVTSLEDSFNQTVAECIACGTPTVAFDNGGIRDIIDNGDNGYLIKYRDILEMLEAIDKCLVSNLNIENITHTIEKRFSNKIIAGNFRKRIL